MTDPPREIAFEMAVASVRFGAGVTREVGMDLADLGARRALVLTDPVVAKLPPVTTVLSPRPADADDLAMLFEEAMVAW